MPELPEVETVVRTLAPHLVRRRIVAARFTSRFVTPGDRSKLAARLAGRTIQKVHRRGKFIIVALDQGTLAIHLGMTGKLLMDAAPGEQAEPLYERFCELLGARRGVFGADMQVELVNDGPVTLLLESR